MLLLAAVVTAWAGMSPSRSLAAPSPRLLVIAHRGGVVDATRTENSLGALDEAIARGYTHVEVDLRSTKDGHAVCLHDRSLKRTTGVDVNIDEVTLAQLYTMVKPEVVPTFEAVAARSQGRLDLMPDVKEVPPELVEAFTSSIGASLKKHDLLRGALFIGSSEVGKRFAGPARMSWRKPFKTFEQEVALVPGATRKYFAFNHPKDFDKAQVDGFHKLGVSVIVTVNLLHYPIGDPISQGRDGIAQAIAMGVDGVQIDSVYDPQVLPLQSADRGAGRRR